MWPRRFLICLLLMLTSLSALAAPRPFPPTALRGMLAGATFPQILINGQLQTLSPGARIMSRHNTIVLPTSLMSNVYIVNYTVDRQGYIDKIWILTDEELAQSPQ